MANIDIAGLTAELAQSAATWTAQENEITELPEEELEKLLGYNPPPDSGELTLSAREALASTAGRIESAFANSAAPAAFDLRDVGGMNYTTPVGNQLSCGSCVAFGSIAAVEGTMRFSRQDPNLVVDLSENHLFNCIARSQGRACSGPNGGWWMDPAMRALRDEGVVDENCSPYSPADQPCVLCADEAQRRVRILTFEELRSVAAMKEWIATKGPLAACFSVYSDFSAYSSGVYRRTSNVSRGGHCVCVVGYDDGASAWICKNSWGTGWGEAGYFRIGYGECGIDASMWGVQTGASPTPGGTYVPLYRYWNPQNADHFYTTSWQEVGEGRWGWGYEGVQCYVAASAMGGLVPLYRYWNPDIGDHFYTTAWEELGEGRWGWGYEGVQCYVAPSQLPGTVPLYRYWNADGGDHFYTTSWEELGEGRWGWAYEGVQCYVWPTAAGSGGRPPATFRASGRAESRGPSASAAGTRSAMPSMRRALGPAASDGLPPTFRTSRTDSRECLPGTFRRTRGAQRSDVEGCGCGKEARR